MKKNAYVYHYSGKGTPILTTSTITAERENPKTRWWQFPGSQGWELITIPIGSYGRILQQVVDTTNVVIQIDDISSNGIIIHGVPSSCFQILERLKTHEQNTDI